MPAEYASSQLPELINLSKNQYYKLVKSCMFTKNILNHSALVISHYPNYPTFAKY